MLILQTLPQNLLRVKKYFTGVPEHKSIYIFLQKKKKFMLKLKHQKFNYVAIFLSTKEAVLIFWSGIFQMFIRCTASRSITSWAGVCFMWKLNQKQGGVSLVSVLMRRLFNGLNLRRREHGSRE